MGLLSGGNSSQSSSQTSTDNSQQVGQTNTSGITLGASSGNTISILDNGAIENALTFAEMGMSESADIMRAALTGNLRSTDAAFSFGMDAFDGAMGFSENALSSVESMASNAMGFSENALNSVESMASTAMTKISEASRSDSQQFMNATLSTVQTIALGLGAVFIIYKMVGK